MHLGIGQEGGIYLEDAIHIFQGRLDSPGCGGAEGWREALISNLEGSTDAGQSLAVECARNLDTPDTR